MKLIPKKQGGGGFKPANMNNVASWLNVPTAAETAVKTSNWGPIAGYNAASKIFKINPEISKQYGGSASKYANFLLANPNEILKYPGFRQVPNYKPGAATSPFEYSNYSSGEIQMDKNPSKKFNATVGGGRRVATGVLTPTAK